MHPSVGAGSQPRSTSPSIRLISSIVCRPAVSRAPARIATTTKQTARTSPQENVGLQFRLVRQPVLILIEVRMSAVACGFIHNAQELRMLWEYLVA